MRIPELALLVAATVLFLSGSAGALHGPCPVEVDFPFLDLDGNLCHDPTDSGDITADLLSTAGPYTPAAGNLVCPAGATLISTVPDSTEVVTINWVIPGTVVLDCKVKLWGDLRTFEVEAGADILLDAKFKTRSHQIYLAPNGSIETGFKTKFIGRLDVTLAAGDDITLGERTLVRAGHFGGNLFVLAGQTVTMGDKCKLDGRDSGSVITVSGHDVLIGERVKMLARDRGRIFVDADPVTGTVNAEKIVILGENAANITGGTVTVGARSKGDFTLTAESAIIANEIKGLSPATFTLNTAGTISVTDAIFKKSHPPTATIRFTTAPGGTCDVTGSIFHNYTLMFTGCTPIGP